MTEDSENMSEMVAETSEASKDQQSESATSENNTCTAKFRASANLRSGVPYFLSRREGTPDTIT